MPCTHVLTMAMYGMSQRFCQQHPPVTVLAQYVDALRLGKLDAFCDIETESGDWWHVLLDRGAGAALHFAVDHGQARSVESFTCKTLQCKAVQSALQQSCAVLASIDDPCRGRVCRISTLAWSRHLLIS